MLPNNIILELNAIAFIVEILLLVKYIAPTQIQSRIIFYVIINNYLMYDI